MNQNQVPITPAPKKPSGFRFSRLLMVLIAVVLVAVIATLVMYSKNKSNATLVKPDTVDEIKIKQYLSSLRGDIVRYYDSKKTYAGWAPNQTVLAEVDKMGTKLKTQALTDKTYIIYAEMPTSKTVFCMDSNNFTAEISHLYPWQKACK